jgi:hypothetical protein
MTTAPPSLEWLLTEFVRVLIEYHIISPAVAAGVVALLVLLGWMHLRNPTPPPTWDPEKGTGPLSPPLDMPEGGATLKQDRKDDWQ